MKKINYPTWLVHVYAKLKPACAKIIHSEKMNNNERK
jgi:hypothetical protein